MDIFVDLGALLAALMLIGLLIVHGGSVLASILLHREPEEYLTDPAARRSVLRG
jgi:hypothetical protein